ncbi:hypothetical protein M9H77_23231 [Catharanthus roseus]|uniref:Uncharacterized protein n=1 Tax=Catharanthus roseus TaxID=4058 RepID=A0ACC0AWS9_CATRO|nr:hypothetical protein M9H77_23231 [Catharanthus roseus]
MIAYMEDALKSNIEEFDGQGKPPNYPTANGRVAPTVAGRILFGLLSEVDNLPRTVALGNNGSINDNNDERRHLMEFKGNCERIGKKATLIRYFGRDDSFPVTHFT